MRSASGPAGLILVLAGAALTAQGPVHRDEAEIMLFTLNLDRRQLAEAFPGYPGPGDAWLLPLGELCQALFLGIKVDARQGRAEGFIIDEKRRLALDLKTGRLDLAGKALAYDPAGVEWHEDDIYVDSRQLEAWLPVALKVDSNAAAIRVEPREQLPVQGAWEREQRAGFPMPGAAGDDAKGYPYLPTPYSFLDLPFLDQTATLVSARDNDRRQLTASGTTFLTGDLLWMNGTGYFNSVSGNMVDNARLDLVRRDPYAGLLGPLRAREVELGDLMNTGQPLLGSPIQGRGLHVDNLPLNFQYSFERYSFRGNLLPGWSVELYQNDVLLAIQQSRADGLYEFRSVPTYFGVNDFKLVFYGPEGQRRVEWQRMDQRQAQTPAGQFLYNLVATGPSADPTQAASSHRQYLAEAAYGLSRRWDFRAMVTQVGSSLTTVPSDGDPAAPAVPSRPNRYGGLALQGFLGDVSVQMSGAVNQDHGTLGTLGLGTGLGYNSLTVRRSFLHNFETPDFHSTTPLKAHTQVQLVLMPTPGKGIPGSLNFDQTRDDFAQGGHQTSSSVRAALALWNTSLSNTITWTRADTAQSQGTSASTAPTTGTFLISQRILQASLRGQADYDLERGRTTVRDYSLVGEYYGLRGYTLSAEMQRDLVQRENRYRLGLNKFEGHVGLQAALGWSRSTSLTASLQLHLTLGRDPGSGLVFAEAKPVGNSGAVSGRAFLDSNGNGRRDPDEPLLEGAALQVGGASHPGPLGERAPLFVTDLYPTEEVSLTLATNGMDDPFLRPAQPGVRILPRPGKVARVDFPMVVSGEITGIAQMAGPKGARDLAGLALELLDEQGRRVLAVRSSFDGFFDMKDLAPGRYQLRVLPEEAQRLDVSLPAPRFLEIQARGSIHEGILMKVVPLESGSNAATGAVPAAVPATPAPQPPLPATVPKGPTLVPALAPAAGATAMNLPAAAPAPQPPAPARLHGEWSIQLGAYFKAASLDEERRALGDQAKDLRVESFQDPVHGQGFRLLLGRYASRAEAARAVRQLPARFRRSYDHAFPVALNPEAPTRRLP